GALADAGMSYGVVRPTVMFGGGDVFINNIAWLLRTFPFFPVPGWGDYRLQPVHVDDVADICLDLASRHGDHVTDAAGPEIFTFEGLLRRIRDGIDARCRLIHIQPSVALAFARMVGVATNDVVLTR